MDNVRLYVWCAHERLDFLLILEHLIVTKNIYWSTLSVIKSTVIPLSQTTAHTPFTVALYFVLVEKVKDVVSCKSMKQHLFQD